MGINLLEDYFCYCHNLNIGVIIIYEIMTCFGNHRLLFRIMRGRQTKPVSKYQNWIDAQKRFKLSDEHILMVRELGMNPKKFGSLSNSKQEPWKAPLPEFIEELYLKRFGRTQTNNLRTFNR